MVDREKTPKVGSGVSSTKSFDEQWMITMSDREEDWTDILNAVPEWRYGKEHPTKRGFYVDDMSFDRDGDSFELWEATISYTDDWPDEPDPRKRAAIYSLQSITHSYTELIDADGVPFLNTAGDFLQDLPAKKITAWRLTIKKNLPKKWPLWILKFNEAVNKSEIKIAGLKWPKETLKISDLSIGEPEEENEIQFCSAQMVIEFHPKTWAIRSINRGTSERYPKFIYSDDFFSNEATVEWLKRPISDSEKVPIDKPVFLDENGTAIRDIKLKSPVDGVFEYQGELKTKFEPEDKQIVMLENWNNDRLEFKDLPTS